MKVFIPHYSNEVEKRVLRGPITLKKPEPYNHKKFCEDAEYANQYQYEVDVYNNHIRMLPTTAMPDMTPEFGKREEVVEGVDFRVQHQWQPMEDSNLPFENCDKEVYDLIAEKNRRIIAIAIEGKPDREKRLKPADAQCGHECRIDEEYEKEIVAGAVLCGGCGRRRPGTKYVLASSITPDRERGVTVSDLLNLLAEYGGTIESTGKMDEMNIKQARASNRMWVDNNGLGYVWMPGEFSNGPFPETPKEVELFERWFPLPVELPDSLKNMDWMKNDSTASQSVEQPVGEQGAEYWKHRCKLAEKFIESGPCASDTTSEQIKAYDEYKKFLAGSPIPKEPIRNDSVATPTAPASSVQGEGDATLDEILKGQGIYPSNKNMWTYARIKSAMQKFAAATHPQKSHTSVVDFIHKGVEFSKSEQFKLSGEAYRSGVGFGYSCGYQDALSTRPPKSDASVEEVNKNAREAVKARMKIHTIPEAYQSLITGIAFDMFLAGHSSQQTGDAVEFARWIVESTHFKPTGKVDEWTALHMDDGWVTLSTAQLFELFIERNGEPYC